MVPYTREETVRLLANGLRTYAIPDEKLGASFTPPRTAEGIESRRKKCIGDPKMRAFVDEARNQAAHLDNRFEQELKDQGM